MTCETSLLYYRDSFFPHGSVVPLGRVGLIILVRSGGFLINTVLLALYTDRTVREFSIKTISPDYHVVSAFYSLVKIAKHLW